MTRNRFRKNERIGNVNVIRLWRLWDYYCHIKDSIKWILLNHRFTRGAIKRVYDFFTNPLYNLILKHSCYGESSFANNISTFIDSSKYDIVVTYVRPGQNAAAAYNIKLENPQIKWINCYFDMYSSVPFYDEETLKVLREQESLWTKTADVSIYAKDLAPLVIKTEFWNDKTLSLPIPAFALKDITPEEDLSDSLDYIDVAYTGQFYEDIRRADFLLELFRAICERCKNVRLHIAGRGMESTIESYKIVMGDNLIIYGCLSLEETNELLNKANILVNVGNTVPYFLPSKLLSYLKTCKPILHIFSNSEDVSIGYMDRYPLHLCIEQQELNEELVRTVLDFIEDSKDKRCDPNEIKRVYAEDSAEYFTERLVDIFRTLVNDKR